LTVAGSVAHETSGNWHGCPNAVRTNGRFIRTRHPSRHHIHHIHTRRIPIHHNHRIRRIRRIHRIRRTPTRHVHRGRLHHRQRHISLHEGQTMQESVQASVPASGVWQVLRLEGGDLV
jgi:hypothetical protein